MFISRIEKETPSGYAPQSLIAIVMIPHPIPNTILHKLWYVQRQTGCCKERRTVIFITNITGGSYLFALLFCKFYRIYKNNLQTC